MGPVVRRRFLRWLAVLSSLLWVAPWLLSLPRVGRLPNNDYYGILEQVLGEGHEWSASPIAWARVRSNEHRVAVPTLLYALNVELAKGDSRGLSLWAIGCLVGIHLLLVGLLPARARAQPLALWLLANLMGCLVFNPVQAHSIVMGFSGTIWLSSNLLTVVAVCALCRYGRDLRWPWLGLALGAGLVGFFTNSTSLSMWPALVAGAIVLARPRAAAVIAAVGSLLLAASVAGYSRPAHLPPPELSRPDAVALFATRYLGALFESTLGMALFAGALGLAATAAAWVAALRSGDRKILAPWIMLQIYALANAVGTASGRVGKGAGSVFQSRYANLATLFWIGLAMLLAILVLRRTGWRIRGRAPLHAAYLLATGVVAWLVWARGGPVLERYLDRARRQGVGELALRLDVQAPGVLAPVSFAEADVWRLRPALAAMGHVPFDREPVLEIGRELSELDLPPPAAVSANVTAVRPLAGGGFGVSGLVDASADVEWILLVDESGVLRGVGQPLPRRSRQGVGLLPEPRWRGFALADPATLRLRVVGG